MRVTLIESVAELESLAPEWRRLAKGHPFLGPDWMLAWWRHVGGVSAHQSRPPRLATLAVHDEQGQLTALVPWYLEHSLLNGRTLRFLGSGEVCSDYLSIACQTGAEAAVLSALATWLSENHGRNSANGWDLIALEAVDLTDPRIKGLLEALETRGAITSTRPAGNCWRIALPPTWEEYLMQLSKTNRKRARRLDRNYLQTGRAQLHRVTTPDELAEGYRLLVDLHTRRWTARGGKGIFADPAIYDFHHEALASLLATGHLRLSWLTIDDQPAAAEYCLTDGNVVYSYQSGLDPALIAHEPGVLMLVATVQDVIECGYTGLDFLRGDEPYKLDWRSVQHLIHDVRILPGNWPGHVRQSLWQAATSAKDWLRAGRDVVLQGT